MRLTFSYNLHGLLVLSQAQLMEEVPAAAPEAPTANGKALEAEEEKKEEGAGAGEQQPVAAEAAKPAKKKYKAHSLTVATTAPGLSTAEKNAFVEQEAQMAQQDRIIRETADMRNALESYIYDMKAKLGDALRPYVEEAAAAVYVGQLEAMENWLYDEGFDSTKSIYSAKLAELQAVGDPVVRRQEEAAKREPARAALVATLEEYKGMVKSTEEKYAHIADEERDKVRAELQAAETWLYDLLAKQGELPLHADPVLTVQAIKDKQNALAHVRLLYGDACVFTSYPACNKASPTPFYDAPFIAPILHINKTTQAVLPVMNRPKPAPPAPAPAPAEGCNEEKAEGEAAPEAPAAGEENGPTAMDEGAEAASPAPEGEEAMDTTS